MHIPQAEAAVVPTDQIVRDEAVARIERMVREEGPGHPVAFGRTGDLAGLVRWPVGQMVVDMARAALQEGPPPKVAQKDWYWTKGFDSDLAR